MTIEIKEFSELNQAMLEFSQFAEDQLEKLENADDKNVADNVYREFDAMANAFDNMGALVCRTDDNGGYYIDELRIALENFCRAIAKNASDITDEMIEHEDSEARYGTYDQQVRDCYYGSR